ncbi:uncharacterized protein BJ171DRAFT_600226 [Polychytrium aggregatum]|uniref:uncharacterized protein n=1 Tax=Polychytrium aggregatum TaxID=110093 RepID=UPI0022FEB50F|nr:uncharacterized protein BJ171DRAFT_600226 [Polychytrium aggregatum]KAI9203381.1 hypothetical protein BJ171DRAFT_600226 [Polychytrium aggregatum]
MTSNSSSIPVSTSAAADPCVQSFNLTGCSSGGYDCCYGGPCSPLPSRPSCSLQCSGIANSSTSSPWRCSMRLCLQDSSICSDGSYCDVVAHSCLSQKGMLEYCSVDQAASASSPCQSGYCWLGRCTPSPVLVLSLSSAALLLLIAGLGWSLRQFCQRRSRRYPKAPSPLNSLSSSSGSSGKCSKWGDSHDAGDTIEIVSLSPHHNARSGSWVSRQSSRCSGVDSEPAGWVAGDCDSDAMSRSSTLRVPSVSGISESDRTYLRCFIENPGAHTFLSPATPTARVCAVPWLDSPEQGSPKHQDPAPSPRWPMLSPCLNSPTNPRWTASAASATFSASHESIMLTGIIDSYAFDENDDGDTGPHSIAPMPTSTSISTPEGPPALATHKSSNVAIGEPVLLTIPGPPAPAMSATYPRHLRDWDAVQVHRPRLTLSSFQER